MSRDQRITIYVSDEEKRHLEAEAEEAGESVSSYVYKLMQRQRKAEAVDQAATDLSAEEKIESMVADARDEIEQVADDIRDLNARAGVYSVANFELLKHSFPDAQRADALSTGARRLRQPISEHPTAGGDDDEQGAGDRDDDRRERGVERIENHR